MRPDDIREVMRRQPFRPFRLILSNNVVHEIRHRDFVFVTRSVLKIGSAVMDGEEPDQEKLIGVALVHIVQYELLPAITHG
jgi:hypothetical protein